MTTALAAGSKIEETALTTTIEQQTAGLVSAAAKEQHEIQSAIVIAKKMPRNEDAAFQRLMKAASRTSFAEDAAYKFPRGGQDVTGPSVNIAREAARVWGNIRYGLDVIADGNEEGREMRTIRGWAWDLESNTKTSADDKFEKLVQRKNKTTGKTEWIAPDERDLRELTNRRGAILKRNCILELLPRDLIEDALEMCAKTLTSTAEKDPDLARKRVLAVFAEVNVTLEMLEEKLGHALNRCTPKELAELRQVGVSIRDGHSTWKQYADAAGATESKVEEQAQAAELTDLQTKLAEKRATGNGQPAGTRPAQADPGVDGAAATPVSASEAPEAAETISDSSWLDLKSFWEDEHGPQFAEVKKRFKIKNTNELTPAQRVQFKNSIQDAIKAAAKA